MAAKWFIGCVLALLLAIGITPAPVIEDPPDDGGGCTTILFTPYPGAYADNTGNIRSIQSTCDWLIVDLVAVGDADWNNFGGIQRVMAHIYFDGAQFQFTGWQAMDVGNNLCSFGAGIGWAQCVLDTAYYNSSELTQRHINCTLDRGWQSITVKKCPFPVNQGQEVKIFRLTFTKQAAGQGYIDMRNGLPPVYKGLQIRGGNIEVLTEAGYGGDVNTY